MRNKWIKWFSDLLMQPQASQAHVVMLPNEALILKGKLNLTELPKRKRSLKKLWPRWNTNNVYLVIIMCPGVRNTSKHEFTSDFSLCNFVIALPLRGKIFNSFFFYIYILKVTLRSNACLWFFRVFHDRSLKYYEKSMEEALQLANKINAALAVHDKKVRPNAGGEKINQETC